MRSISALLLCLATLLSPQALAESGSPIAIRKVAPGSHDKLLREHLAFAPLHSLTPREAAAAAISFLEEQDDKLVSLNGTERPYRPAFAPHSEESHESLLRRAAEERALMELRVALQNLAEDAVFRDMFAKDWAVSVPSAVATQRTTTQDQTTVLTPSQEPTSGVSTVEPTTKTETEVGTTGEPTTSEVGTTTETETEVDSGTEDSTVTATPTATGSATGIAPYRPTGTSVTLSDDGETQTGCPTGFYGCLATHGGGCCRTGRNCDVHDCPAPSTTIVSNGATVVVLATDAPPAPGPSSTCADGWFLCGRDAGPVAGCCPDGYDCGTASCFTAQASETGRVQKEFPKADAAAYEKPAITLAVMMAVLCVALV
ncbi:hypothetical protein J7337_005805 [Fusarium musae]|uniref:GPI anchored protein n=1 Tax=Fusarium musae TaxID=1042133 RepID=A0A9P8IRM4_9HYPO|nr:hypothetical protein J7337_005805 [Fusarium musae]KAG9502970.1 hypothetical protein J7337_005805 [Fusarium musae]